MKVAQNKLSKRR